MKAQTLIIILHDSITNSVFASQVLTPLMHALAHKKYEHAIIISLEKRSLTTSELHRTVPDRPDITPLIITHRIPFFGTLSLLPAIYAVRRILRTYTNYELQARGPLAGWIAMHARPQKTIPLMIQARGLLAQEHAYAQTHQQKSRNPLLRILNKMRTKLYARTEASVYGSHKPALTIEAVSAALAHYLVTAFQTNPARIRIAQDDIPAQIPTALVTAWRAAYRSQLGITHNAPVFCYNGSGKAWQCPHLVFTFFHEKLAKNPRSILLILTQDQKEFAPSIARYGIERSVIIKTVAHSEIYAYLAVADVGLLFREQHIVNWISRPTKMLEYEAVGLKIVHNNTIAWLANNKTKSDMSKKNP